MLDILTQLNAYDRPFPKIGCGLKFCFEEDEFEITPGTESDIIIELNSAALVTNGDTMQLHGYNFRFVSGAPTNLQEIQIAALDGTATNLYNSLLQIPFFIDNYIIDNSVAYKVQLTSQYAEFDERYYFSATTANADAIRIDPLSSPTQGTNAVYKEDYYIFFDIFDEDTGEKLCTVPIFKPINILSDGTAKACVDIQPIIARYPNLYTAPPLPYQGVYQGTNRPDNFDENYVRNFRLRVWNSYKDVDGENCDKVQSDFIEIPEVPGLKIEVANFVAPENTCNGNAFFDYSFPAIVAQTQKWITVMPESYKICQESAIELRFDYDVGTINSVGGDLYMRLIINFTDGSTINNITQWDRSLNGVHVANLSFGPIGSDATIQLSAPFDSKTISSVQIDMFHTLFGIEYRYLEPRYIYFDNNINHKVSCCESLTSFYFLSTVGNNDILLGKDGDIDLEVEFDEFCREQKCCGTEYYGTNHYNTGKLNSGLKEDSKIYTAKIEASGDYLDEFLLSPFKWVYDRDSSSLFAIKPTQNSYKIFKVEGRNILFFTYKKTLIRQHFKL